MLYILMICNEFGVIPQRLCQIVCFLSESGLYFEFQYQHYMLDVEKNILLVLSHDIRNIDIHRKKRFFFLLIIIFSLFIYSLCNAEVKMTRIPS